MSDLHEFPYTRYEEDGCCNNLGCFMGMCRRVGVKLAFNNGVLELLDPKGYVLDSVQIEYSKTAAQDLEGRPITSYLINAGIRDKYLVLRRGNSEEIILTIPYAEMSKYTVNGDEITSFVKGFTIDGNQVRITLGDGSSALYTIPFATMAATDINSKDLTSYGAGLAVDGNTIVLTDGQGRIINQITPNFAVRAREDENGNDIRENYASSLVAGTTTLKLFSKSGDLLSEITPNYAIISHQDENGNLFLHDYAESLTIDNDGKRLDLLAHDGTLLSAVRVPWSDLSEHANKSIERAEIVGDQIVFTTYEGNVVRLTIPYALRCDKDGLSNVITDTYLTRVTQDPTTGQLDFYNAEQEIVCSLVPDARRSTYDGLDNVISDYIKTLVFDNQAKYLKATHGDGTVDSILISYAQACLKDDIGNTIKNVYLTSLYCETNVHGDFELVGLNGEQEEILRIKILAYKAQLDVDGDPIRTTYATDLTQANTDLLQLVNKDGTVLGSVQLYNTYAKKLEQVADDQLKLKDKFGVVLDTIQLYNTYGKSLNINNDEELELNDKFGTLLNKVVLPDDLKDLEVVQKCVGKTGIAHNNMYDASTQAIDLTKKIDLYSTPSIKLWMNRRTGKPIFETIECGKVDNQIADSAISIIPIGQNTSLTNGATQRFETTQSKLNGYFNALWTSLLYKVNGETSGWSRCIPTPNLEQLRLAAANVSSAWANELYCVEEYRQENNTSPYVKRYVKVTNEGPAANYLGVSLTDLKTDIEGYPTPSGTLVRAIDPESAFIYTLNASGNTANATIKNGTNYTVKCYEYDQAHYGWLEVTGGTVTDDVYSITLPGSMDYSENYWIYKIELVDNVTGTSEEVSFACKYNALNL